MSVSKKRYALVAVLISLCLGGALFLNGSGRAVNADTEKVYKNIEIFTEVLRQIEKSYVEPQDSHELIYGAIKGMVQNLDPHSSFMTKEEHQELMLETKGSFTGIGVEITVKDDILTVVSPIEGTPAYNAGMKAGDQIIRIEDAKTKDMSLLEAVKKIRGPKGTKVNLTIMRPGEDKPLEFSITRGVIPLISVRHHFLTPEICYLRISNFQSKTSHDLSSALEDLEGTHDIKGLVLDLRNNPGGLLSQAIEVSDLFLDSGLIVTTKGRVSSQDITASAHKNRVSRKYPIIVLINGGTASAAEIVAGALQDNKRGLVLGTRSFGKGSVQTILPLSDGSGLRLTTARYYTPSGKSIQLKGITPDIELTFIPPVDKKDTPDRKFFREEDLEGHMPNEAKDSEPGVETYEETEQDRQVRVLLENDNQVRHAVELLKSWRIFSRIEGDN
ncbi:MAG: S41 family peptidase [Desulfatiglandaceae bacterium]